MPVTHIFPDVASFVGYRNSNIWVAFTAIVAIFSVIMYARHSRPSLRSIRLERMSEKITVSIWIVLMCIVLIMIFYF